MYISEKVFLEIHMKHVHRHMCDIKEGGQNVSIGYDHYKPWWHLDNGDAWNRDSTNHSLCHTSCGAPAGIGYSSICSSPLATFIFARECVGTLARVGAPVVPLLALAVLHALVLAETFKHQTTGYKQWHASNQTLSLNGILYLTT